MPAQISAVRGAFVGKQFALGDAPCTFGRNPENTVVVGNPRASRRHAEIRREGGEYVLADLGSANGVVVNGQRVTTHRLRAGDVFEIGDDAFRFEAPAADATLVATPAVTPAPPPATFVPPSETPAPVYQPPAPTPAPPATPAPSRRAGGRTLLIVLGLVGVVALAACVGGALLITRSGPLIGQQRPTSAPRATAEGGAQPPIGNGAGEQATREPVAGSADWTVLVYLDGDNNLEGDAVGDFNEMEQAGSNDNVKIVAEFDRIRQDGPEDDSSNGDWDTTKRFLVQHDEDPDAINSEELADLGEQNMGDPQTLADFISWGVQTYPARHYALVLWDHGSSWAGIAFDDTSGEKGIRLPELAAALRTAQSQTGVERLDLIGFDACLMAQVDVLDTIAPYGNVAVASAELEPNEGWAWDVWLKQLEADPQQDAATIGDAIVRSYGDFYQNGDDDTPTLAAFDLSRIETLRGDLNALSDAMLKDMNGSYQAIAEARSYAEAYSQPKPEQFSAIDLGDFTRLLDERGAPDDIKKQSQAVREVLDQARIAEWHASFHGRSTGMSVFFPQVAELYPDAYEDASPLPQETSWGKFLKTFHQAGTTQVSAPEITNLQLSSAAAGVNNPLTLQGTVSGKDIAYVFFFVGVPHGDQNVELTDIDFIYPPGSSPNAAVPPWSDGANDLSQTWDGTRWALSNGSETVPVLLGPAKYGTDQYGVEGIYASKATGEQINAGLLFRVRSGRAELQSIWGFPKSQKQEAQPFQLSPEAGDVFTPLLRSYSVQNGKLTPDFVQGDPITFGDQPLSAIQVPASSGDYVTGFLVRDISGQFNYRYESITVDNAGAGQVSPGQQPAPTAGPGAQSGTLAFSSQDLGFSLEYPAAWMTLDSGNSQVYFYDPSDQSATYVSVDAYTTDQSAEASNQALLDQYDATLAKERDYQRDDAQPFQLAGQAGQSFKYQYTDKNGNAMTGIAIAVTSPSGKRSYLVTLQALSADFDGQSDTFNAVLDSMRIE